MLTKQQGISVRSGSRRGDSDQDVIARGKRPAAPLSYHPPYFGDAALPLRDLYDPGPGLELP